MRNRDPAQRIAVLGERVEVEDSREDLRREDGDWNEHVAAREHGEDKTLRSVNVLVSCGKSCRSCLGCLDGGSEHIHLAFETGEHVLERSGCLRIAIHEEF